MSPRAAFISGRTGRPTRGASALRAWRRSLLALLAVATLAGCSRNQAPEAYLCPRVAIINGLASLDHKDATGAVTYRAALENLDGTCRPDGPDLMLHITVDVVVQPAKGFAGGTVELPYFVAASAPNGDVLDRQDFVAKVGLAPGSRAAGVTESITQRFVGRATGASDHQVLFGFVLPTDEALRQRDALF